MLVLAGRSIGIHRFRYIACMLVRQIHTFPPLLNNANSFSQVDFDRNGRKIYRKPEPEGSSIADVGGSLEGSSDIEEELMVFSGCKGKIISPKNLSLGNSNYN